MKDPHLLVMAIWDSRAADVRIRSLNPWDWTNVESRYGHIGYFEVFNCKYRNIKKKITLFLIRIK